MRTLRHSGHHIPKTAAFFLWPVLLLIWALSPSRASATCVANPDPDIRQLQTMVGVDAGKALKQAQSRLDALSHDSSAAKYDSSLVASLYAVQAQAYGILELSTEARTAASEGLRLATHLHDPVHLELLSTYAENVYDAAGIADEIKSIERARIAQTRGSAADTCLLITRGLMENRQGRADLAIVSLTPAYNASTSPIATEPHILAASTLSIVVREMGDYAQALALNQQKIDWDTSHGATLSLSVWRSSTH